MQLRIAKIKQHPQQLSHKSAEIYTNLIILLPAGFKKFPLLPYGEVLQERMRRKHGDAIKKASPPFYSSAECVEQEQHFTPAQIAKQWGVSVYTVRRLFADVPGVLKIGQKGKHVSLRVPGRLLKAYHAKMSACRYRTSSASTFKKSRTKITRFVR